MKEDKFLNSRKPSHRQVHGEFWNLRGQHNREETNRQTNKNKKTQNTCLTATVSEEVAPRFTSATSEQGLDMEARPAQSMLRVRTRPECPEDNLRELT